MMDTNVWSAYYAGKTAEYAMGGPTIEMFCASYNNTHSNNILECNVINEYGYKISKNTGFVADEYNGIYINQQYDNKADGMWIASPASNENESLFYIYDALEGIFIGDYDIGEAGIRPIVCLKQDVKLELQPYGIYQIVY